MTLSHDMAKPVTTLGDRYLDLPLASEYSTLGISTLRQHIRSGRLPAYRVRGKLLIRKTEFDAWIESFRIKSEHDLGRFVDETLQRLQE